MGAFGTLKLSGQFLLISALLHLPATFLSGFAPVGLFMGGVFVFYLLLSMGLTREMRWVGYLAFICMLIGIIGALAQVGAVPVPEWLIWAIIAVDILVVLNLFVALWRPRPEPG